MRRPTVVLGIHFAAEGDLLGIFPEGGITNDGQLKPFKGGIMRILEQRPVPVIPLALQNLSLIHI